MAGRASLHSIHVIVRCERCDRHLYFIPQKSLAKAIIGSDVHVPDYRGPLAYGPPVAVRSRPNSDPLARDPSIAMVLVQDDSAWTVVDLPGGPAELHVSGWLSRTRQVPRWCLDDQTGAYGSLTARTRG
jgi:hypothetical protein